MKQQLYVAHTSEHRGISDSGHIENDDISVSRGNFTKGLSILAIASHIPQVASATNSGEISTVLHIGGESAGLLLHQGRIIALQGNFPSRS